MAEDDAAPALARLEDGEALSDVYRASISVVLAYLWARSPAARRDAEYVGEQIRLSMLATELADQRGFHAKLALLGEEHAELGNLRRPDLQRFADGLVAEGLSPSYVHTTLLPLRAICRRALSRGELSVNPCVGIELPAVRGRRERFASPQEAVALIAAVPAQDQAIWATAMYAGLGLGVACPSR
jgi:site-specific recombinase XerC